MEIPLIFSTVTGNAFKLADAVKPYVKDGIGPYNIHWLRDDVIDKDTYILFYWCYRGSVDPDTLDLLNKSKGKKIIILGTLGADPNKPYYEKVFQNVIDLVNQQNICLGHFLCRGAIDLVRTSKRLSIPLGEKGHLSQEKFEDQKKSLGHPNQDDINNAIRFIQNIFNDKKELL